MPWSHRGKQYSCRGEYILSLVPKPGICSDDDDEEVDKGLCNTLISEEELDQQLNSFMKDFDVLGEEKYDDNSFTFIGADVEEAGGSIKLLDYNDQSIIDYNYNNVLLQNSDGSSPEVKTVEVSNLQSRKRKKSACLKKNLKVKDKKSKINKKMCKKPFMWTSDLFEHGVKIPTKEIIPDPGLAPIDYFNSLMTSEIIELIVDQTNIYSTRKSGVCGNFTKNDISDFIAILLISGVVKMPCYLDYWARDTRYEKIASIMSRDKYKKIRRFLHFSNDDEENYDDPFWKIRPLLRLVRSEFLKIEEEQKYSVDEMMIPYKGKRAGSKRQYVKSKPIKWGFKFFVRSGVSGIIYDFLPYAGASTFYDITFNRREDNFSISSKFVLALAKTIQNKPLSTLFFDNFFTSPQLVSFLRKEYGILSLGTLRYNRTSGAEFPSDFAKQNRGYHMQLVDNTNQVCLLQWLDNKPVLLLSSYQDSEPIEKILRWNSKTKKKEMISCPKIVKEYNLHMGGVDLTDMLVSLYRNKFRTKKWYMPIFSNIVDLITNNAWLLFKRDHPGTKLPLKEFRLTVAQQLQHFGRRRPHSRSPTPVRLPTQPSVSDVVRKDNVGHWPKYGSKGKCRLCHTGQTTMSCSKCNLRLCLTPKNNCFFNFHM